MEIRDHGVWHRYRPEKLPEAAPANALFARRDGDGVDWYDYVHPGKNFDSDTIKMTIVDGAVGAAVHDPTMLFPGGATVLEIRGGPSGDPQAFFSRKLYDPVRKTFSNPPPLTDRYPDPMADILTRLKALEGKGP